MNFATLQGLIIPEGVVTQIADASGRVIWSATIKFTINGDTYIADRGMTWAEWFASDYNTTGETADDVSSISANGTAVELSAVIVGGTAYEVGFAPSEATVTITSSTGYYSGPVYVTIDGVDYHEAATLAVPIGTVIACHAPLNDNDKLGYVTVNGVTVAENGKGYNYTVIGNVSILLTPNKGGGYMTITEQ